MITLPVVRDSFLETLLWSETDDSGTPLDDNYFLYGDISENTLRAAYEYCSQFIEMAGYILNDESFSMDSDHVGYNLALTCNWQGTGFWDRGLGEVGDKLSRICRSLGSFHLYVGDDGLIYHHS